MPEADFYSQKENKTHNSKVHVGYCKNYLFVCDKGNQRIQVFNAMNGAFMRYHGTKGSLDGEFKSPRAVCVSPSGQMIVSEAEWLLFAIGNQHRIQIFK
jgi:6-phosphogluconolactonase (cycloisomerase 2 family)